MVKHDGVQANYPIQKMKSNKQSIKWLKPLKKKRFIVATADNDAKQEASIETHDEHNQSFMILM